MATDFDLDVVESKLNPTKEGEETETDLFNMDDYDPSEDESLKLGEDDEEKELEEKPEPKAKQPEPEPKKPQDPAQLSKEQVEAIKAEAIKLVGADTILTIKGVEKKLSDFTPQEIVIGLQKGIRADQLFSELAGERRKLEEERALIEKGASVVQDYLDQINSGQLKLDPAADKALEVQPDDEPDVVALKHRAAQQQKELQSLRGQHTTSANQAKLQSIVDEVTTKAKDYPMASVDEVLAVKIARPDIDTDELLRRGHDFFSGKDHFQAILKHNPTLKREYDEEVIKTYLAQKQSAKKITGTKSSSSGSEKVTAQVKKPSRDFKSADSYAKAFLREVGTKGSD